MPDATTIVAIIAALTSTAGLLITSLRKRQDTTVEELKLRASDQEKETKDAKKERDEAREETHTEQEAARLLRVELREEQKHNVEKDRKIFLLRSVLAQNGLPDPTAVPPAEDNSSPIQ